MPATAPIDTKLLAALADRYRIDRELGRGGMATVYLARDIKHDRDVAIKVLSTELGAALGGDRFLAEIRTTARLQHPHIVPLLDSGDAEGLLYYVMPVIAGESLRARLERERQLPIGDAVRIAGEVASALDYAHRHGVIHRDIKPENILLHDGQALVADFGIALALQSAGGARMTQTGMSLGTPQYMSPEQAVGERTIDARADIYALGAVTYEMLAGNPPFSGSSMQVIVAKVVNEKPASLFSVRDTVPPGVEDAVLTALAKLPADRFATAAEFASALRAEGAVSAATARARSTNAGDTGNAALRRARTQSRIAWTVSAVAVVAAATLGAFMLARPQRAPDVPVVRAHLDLPAGERLSINVSGAIALSAQGDRIAYVTEGPNGRRAYVRRTAELTPHLIAGADISDLTFSPDGAWLAFRDGREFEKMPSDGGAITRLGTAPQLFLFGMTWATPEMIVFGSNDGLWTLAANGGAIERFAAKDSTLAQSSSAKGQVGARMAFPFVLPDGKSILFSQGLPNRGPRIAVADIASRKVTELDVVRSPFSPLGMVDEYLLYGTAGRVMALPFDLANKRPTGSPAPVADSVFSSAIVGNVAAVSAAGTIVYRSGLTSQMMLVDPLRSEPLRPEPGVYRTPRFSPDGRRVAVEKSAAGPTDIWVFDRIDKTFTRFTTEGENTRPAWSGDGKRIVFTRPNSSTAYRSIWSRVADGSAAAELLYQPDEPINEVSVSPDDKWLLYRTIQEARHRADIFAVPLSGDRKAIPIITGPAAEQMPRVSPDNKWLVYESDESGRYEIYVTPFPGPGPRIQISDQGGTEPVWARTGRTVYYRAGDRLIGVTSGGDATHFSIDSRRDVLKGDFVYDPGGSTPNYDVSPDGKQFLMLKQFDPDANVVVVYNWRRELRETFKPKKQSPQ